MKYFKVHELVPESVYKRRGTKAMQLIDTRVQVFLDNLREALGAPITVNTWRSGGCFSQRGLRTREFYKSDQAYIDSLSQHKYGRGVDFDVKGLSVKEVHKWLIENRNLAWVRPVTFVETGVNWVHVDCRFTTEDGDLWLWNVETGKTEVYKR